MYVMCWVRHTHERSAEIIMDMERDDQVSEYAMNGGRQVDGGRGREEGERERARV
jgi:hypothetical protein